MTKTEQEVLIRVVAVLRQADEEIGERSTILRGHAEELLVILLEDAILKEVAA